MWEKENELNQKKTEKKTGCRYEVAFCKWPPTFKDVLDRDVKYY